jgi:two-component system, chemotaxis family, chemotaxis protein CheY
VPDGPVMIVDDDQDIRDALSEFLEDEGFKVITADNGRDALDLLRGGASPRVILLDLMMPVMDGWSFLKERRKDPSLEKIPVVIITAAGDVESVDVDIVPKPIESKRVLELVRRYS